MDSPNLCILEIISRLLEDKDLALKDGNVRYYTKGSSPEDDMARKSVQWANARRCNKRSDVCLQDNLLISFEESPDLEALASVDMADVYRVCKEHGVEQAFRSLKETLLEFRASNHSNRIFSELNNPEWCKEHLIVRPLNYRRNSEVLSRCVHHTFGDIAVVACINFGDDDGLLKTALLDSDLLALTGLRKEVAFSMALNNSVRQYPISYIKHSSTNCEQMEIVPAYDLFNSCRSKEVISEVGFTTSIYTNGAVSLFYPGAFRWIWNCLGEDYFVVFSNMHCYYILPVSMFNNVNAMLVLIKSFQGISKPDEILSDTLYYYSKLNDALRPIASIR